MDFWTAWPKHLLADVSLWSADLATLRVEVKRCEQTVPFLRRAGADLVVPGSLVFKSDHLAQTFQWLHTLSI